MDLRTRVVAAVSAGRSCREAAATLAVSVVRWSQRARATGSPAPKPIGGRRHRTLLPARDRLLARIAAAPDLTVRALQAAFAAHGRQASYGALWAFLAEKGLSFKKACTPPNRIAPPSAKLRTGTWRASGCGGRRTSIGLTPSDWFHRRDLPSG